MITQVSKVLVGSRLHGLHTEASDWDWRGVHMHDLKTILSPFKKQSNTQWIEGDEDNTSYELNDFCKSAVKGNATILEVFFSDVFKETSPVAEEMRANWQKFIDTDQFVAASRGYAHNQYNKMQLFEPDKRTPKFAVAYLRVLWQCEQFLLTNKFPCFIHDDELRAYLLDIKHNFSVDHVPKLTEMFMNLQARVTDAYARATILKPDIDWIEDFIHGSYTKK